MAIAAGGQFCRNAFVMRNILCVGRDLRFHLWTAAALSAAVMRCWDNSLCYLNLTEADQPQGMWWKPFRSFLLCRSNSQPVPFIRAAVLVSHCSAMATGHLGALPHCCPECSQARVWGGTRQCREVGGERWGAGPADVHPSCWLPLLAPGKMEGSWLKETKAIMGSLLSPSSGVILV